MANIGDLILGLIVDATGLRGMVVKEAQKAGDAAGTTLGQRMSKGMGTAVRSGVGAGAGLLFSVAAKGANDLTNAMAEFQAETGATQEELDSARASVIELSKTNVQSFEEIVRAQAALRTDLGLTQEEAEAASEAFLNYGTATGRDATEGVKNLDDILDAWNLDASKSGEIMDKLVASHQEYGGSITDNEAALSNLAPQLQALNLDVDDGISLLNLFASSGLDASKSQAALNSAINKLPEGTSLEEFIAQLAAIEDPGERARVAIEVFGARGGAGLANAIRPGMTGLSDFAIGMDEAAGATTEAAAAIENTPFNQLKQTLRGIAAPAIEAGQSFGPLIMALSQLGGGKLLAGVASGLGGVGGAISGKLLGALKGVGGRFAAALGLELGSRVVSDAVADGVGDAVTKAGGSSKLTSATNGLGKLMGSTLGKALSVGFAAIAVVEVINTYNDVKDGLNEQSKQIGEGIGEQIATGSLESLQQSKAALETGLQELNGVWDAGLFTNEQRANMQAQLDSVNAAIAEKSKQMTATAADGLESGRHTVDRAAANALEDPMTDALDRAVVNSKPKGAAVSNNAASGINSTSGSVTTAADRLRQNAENRLDAIDGKGAGQKAGGGLASGLNGSTVRSQLAGVVSNLASFVSRLFGQKTNLRVNIRGNIGVSGARAEGGPVGAGQTYLVGERGPELFVPSASGQIVPNSSLSTTNQTNSNTNIFNVETHGLPLRARTPLEVAQQLRRVATTGQIGPSPKLVPSNG